MNNTFSYIVIANKDFKILLHGMNNIKIKCNKFFIRIIISVLSI